jgi:hypothetical protein
MEVIEDYEHVCAEPTNILEKMRRIDIIETATRELRMSTGLNPETERRFQATETTGQ